ncbi:MAG: hypothetical protein E7568_03505 [Ruminococcaceae bacterium]|nr:hypothetical protein [Oscillospiraceae bacterium]
MKKTKKCLSILLVILILASACIIMPISVSALSNRSGYITDNEVNIRKGPATSYESLGKLGLNTPLEISGVGFNGTNKTIWYKVTATTSGGTIDGYVHSDYVKVTGSDKVVPAVMTRASSVFSHAGDWNPKLCAAPVGMELTVIGEELDYDGDKWYQVYATVSGERVDGYVYAPCLRLEPTYTEDAEFEKYLTSQGFPESYKVKLRQMHALYPNWKFVANHLGLTWDAAVTGETRLGVNTVHSSAPDAWKTMRDGAYDWVKNECIVVDSGGWVTAHENVVRYYLDPRNFLNTEDVFQFISMRYDPALNTKEKLQLVLNNTFMEGKMPEGEAYETYADALMDAAKGSGVSPIALASMILVEQGNNGSGGCISNSSGYYNFYNINAYANNGLSAVQNGINYAISKNWNTRSKAIVEGAKFYSDSYFERGQDTLYYKKFHVTSTPYFSWQYMTNIQGAYGEASKTAKSYANTLSEELIFKIPVYKEMPETLAPYPTTTGNNNCYLEALSIEGQKLTPTFNRYTNNYEAIVDGETSKIKVNAVKSDGAATLTGGGEIPLDVGVNNIKITVKSSSGIVNTYTLSVFREEPIKPVDPVLKSGAYKISDTVICGIPLNTTKTVLASNIKVDGGTFVLEDGDTVKTGDKLKVYDGEGQLRYTYTLAVTFDVNGDGKCSLIDLSLIKRDLLKTETLQGEKAMAADINEDGGVSLIDLSRVKRKLLKLE